MHKPIQNRQQNYYRCLSYRLIVSLYAGQTLSTTCWQTFGSLIIFYRYMGRITMANPIFTLPIRFIPGGTYASPTFADIDGDGDLDALIGNSAGELLFYRNNGTNNPFSTPAVTNPFGLTGVGPYANPTLADIDGDGDLDALVGNSSGELLFFRNTGTASNPVFAAPN
ncbi:MAG: FG-GAP repeat domain-containing protein, partial [Methylococcaceae bacterium]